MNDMLKTAADHLLKVADDIDREAAEKTVFSCDKCAHSASLSIINAAIKTASAEGSPVTVNDKISCVKCSGVMEYAPTASSEAFYIEAGEKGSAMLKEGPKEPVEVEEAGEEKEAAIKAPSQEHVEAPEESPAKEGDPTAPRENPITPPPSADPVTPEEGGDEEESEGLKLASSAGIDLNKLSSYISFGK